jgi:chemotaxis protein CheC
MSALAQAHSAAGADALRELTSIGSGHALTSLSRLAGDVRLSMDVPAVRQGRQLHTIVKKSAGTLVQLHVGGVAPFRFVLLFDDRAAARWAARLLRRDEVPARLGALEESALLELGNIMASAFLDAVARLTKTSLLPGPPEARHGALGPLLAREIEQSSAAVAVVTRFFITGTKVGGRLVMLADDTSAAAWIKRLGVL